MEDKQGRGEKKTPFKAWKALLLILLYVLFCVINGSVSESALVFLFAVAVLVAAGILVGKAASKTVRQRQGREKPPAPAFRREQPAFEQKRAAPAPDRTQPAPVRTYDGDLRETAEQRDREHRIQQLESFYQNGLIDREEYKVLLKKYQR